MPGLTFQVLLKAFTSLLAQRGVSAAVPQRLLEHSSPRLTNDVYTNVDPVLRQAVELLPVQEWFQRSSKCAMTERVDSRLPFPWPQTLHGVPIVRYGSTPRPDTSTHVPGPPAERVV